jgi:hypothetical protein
MNVILEPWMLELWGGGFFLLNKIFLWKSERARRYAKGIGLTQRLVKRAGRRWRIAGWAIYLAGLPPWIKIFYDERDWIAMSSSAGGAPAMLLGLILAIIGLTKKPEGWLAWLTKILDRLTLLIIPIGLGISIWDLGGLGHLSQWLEIGIVLGYLVGSRELGLERARGYLWYVLMHVSCGWLMFHQDHYGLMVLQIISLFFIADAYRVWADARKQEASRPLWDCSRIPLSTHLFKMLSSRR